MVTTTSVATVEAQGMWATPAASPAARPSLVLVGSASRQNRRTSGGAYRGTTQVHYPSECKRLWQHVIVP